MKYWKREFLGCHTEDKGQIHFFKNIPLIYEHVLKLICPLIYRSDFKRQLLNIYKREFLESFSFYNLMYFREKMEDLFENVVVGNLIFQNSSNFRYNF